MEARLVFRERFTVETIDGKRIQIFMDLFLLPAPCESCFPEGFKFSWIAFEEDMPEARILFDCHSPKGPHMHIGQNLMDSPFEWQSLSVAQDLFYSKVIEFFGEIPELRRLMS